MDGWNKNELENAGLFKVLDSINNLDYELRNCRRGSYCDERVVTNVDLAEYLRVLADSLRDAADQVEGIPDEVDET